MFNLLKDQQEALEARTRREQERVSKPETVNQQKKVAFYQQTPEQKFDVTVDAAGNSVSQPVPQSPFTLPVVKQMRAIGQLMRDLQNRRPEDLLAHKSYMLAYGPALEKKHGISAKHMFLSGKGAKESARIAAESPEDYAWLREYSNYL